MQLYESATETTLGESGCAQLVVDAIFQGMRVLRRRMRRERPQDVSVPQFRTLAYLNRSHGASLSDAAEHIGLTLPSMSRAVDGLVTRGLVSRSESPEDRRKIVLDLTPVGRATYRRAMQAALDHLGDQLGRLTPEERTTVADAMKLLLPLLVASGEG